MAGAFLTVSKISQIKMEPRAKDTEGDLKRAHALYKGESDDVHYIAEVLEFAPQQLTAPGLDSGVWSIVSGERITEWKHVEVG